MSNVLKRCKKMFKTGSIHPILFQSVNSYLKKTLNEKRGLEGNRRVHAFNGDGHKSW